MIPDAVIQQVQERTDIVELIGGYVQLRRAGRNFKAPCPFHQEKTPSFVVSPDKQIFHCFGCGAGGNAISFLMKQEKKDFREALETLAERAGIELPKDSKISAEAAEKYTLLQKANQAAADIYHDTLLKNREADKARAYLEKRGIAQETIVDFKLGYAPDSWDYLIRSLRGKLDDVALERAGLLIAKKEGGGYYDRFRLRVMFPIFDAKGGCIAFGGRVLDDSVPKYLNSPETEIYHKGRNLYGLHQARKAIREEDAAIVVEGYMDVIACHQAGVKNVIAPLGTALTPDQARLLKRHTRNVFILYDADKAGEMATLRGLELFLEEGIEVRVVRLEKGHDPDSFIREYGVARFRESMKLSKSLFEYRLSLLKQTHDARTNEGKVKIAGEMLSLLSKAQNEILKSLWIADLSRELGLPESSLAAELSKTPGAGKWRTETAKAAAPARTEEVRPAEKMLLGLMLERQEFLQAAKNELQPEDFINPSAREIVRGLFGDTEETVSASALINRYAADPESVRVIALSSAETEAVPDKKKAFEDCLAWFRRARMAGEREHLRSQLEAAQKDGDKNRISTLLSAFDELNKSNRGIKK